VQLYFPLLIQLPAVAGTLYVILTVIWLLSRTPLNNFRKIALSFMLAGAMIPGAILAVWFSFKADVSGVAIVLWPSSLVLMGLEGPAPSPWSTVIAVCVFAILGNVGLYGTVGITVGGLWNWIRSKMLDTSGRR
jgi:vacuolar-type H+-ATPase subunit I/STV1